jgi:site-specific DNA-methyltransferase (adenine-specific)
MPEQLLGRIIRACSNRDDLVLDPFAGSGTTLAVAKKLHRQFLGFELSTEYCQQARKRLAKISPGDPLDGAPEPLVSVPNTARGRRLEDRNHTATRTKRKRRAPTRAQRRLPGL